MLFLSVIMMRSDCLAFFAVAFKLIADILNIKLKKDDFIYKNVFFIKNMPLAQVRLSLVLQKSKMFARSYM
jgi:hypothetical protein